MVSFLYVCAPLRFTLLLQHSLPQRPSLGSCLRPPLVPYRTNLHEPDSNLDGLSDNSADEPATYFFWGGWGQVNYLFANADPSDPGWLGLEHVYTSAALRVTSFSVPIAVFRPKTCFLAHPTKDMQHLFNELCLIVFLFWGGGGLQWFLFTAENRFILDLYQSTSAFKGMLHVIWLLNNDSFYFYVTYQPTYY